jgi:hypothetical protein
MNKKRIETKFCSISIFHEFDGRKNFINYINYSKSSLQDFMVRIKNREQKINNKTLVKIRFILKKNHISLKNNI